LGTKLYNKLPNYLKNLENLKLFKKQLKTFLLQQTFFQWMNTCPTYMYKIPFQGMYMYT